MSYIVMYEIDNTYRAIVVHNCGSCTDAMRVFRAEYAAECKLVGCCQVGKTLDTYDYD